MTDDLELEEDWDEEGNEDGEIVRVERMRITIEKGQESIRIDKYVMNRLEGATRNKVQQALEEGFIIVNGGVVKSNYKIRPKDEIIIYETRKAESGEVVPEELPLDIVYEDNTLMVVHKKAGMVVHPGCGNYSGTLVNGLAFYLHKTKEEIDTEGLPRVGLVHRIDKDTSGLLVIAKTEEAMVHLSAQFKKHTVHRRYIALVWGDFEENEGTIEVNVGRNLRFRKIMDTFPDGTEGKHAITHYSVLERFNYVTLIELRLETGRTHQMRIHMKSKGHPLFNDATYGGNHIVKGTVFTKYKQFVENCFQTIPRQALHAKELGFVHPATGENMLFTSELPAEMTEVIARWRVYTNGMTKQLREQLNGGGQ